VTATKLHHLCLLKQVKQREQSTADEVGQLSGLHAL
jgi:hypothetical protein